MSVPFYVGERSTQLRVDPRLVSSYWNKLFESFSSFLWPATAVGSLQVTELHCAAAWTSTCRNSKQVKTFLSVVWNAVKCRSCSGLPSSSMFRNSAGWFPGSLLQGRMETCKPKADSKVLLWGVLLWLRTVFSVMCRVVFPLNCSPLYCDVTVGLLFDQLKCNTAVFSKPEFVFEGGWMWHFHTSQEWGKENKQWKWEDVPASMPLFETHPLQEVWGW